MCLPLVCRPLIYPFRGEDRGGGDGYLPAQTRTLTPNLFYRHLDLFFVLAKWFFLTVNALPPSGSETTPRKIIDLRPSRLSETPVGGTPDFGQVRCPFPGGNPKRVRCRVRFAFAPNSAGDGATVQKIRTKNAHVP